MPPTFPDVARIELKAPPLELVVCQLRFPVALGLVAMQPPEQFHNEIRRAYPVTRRGQTTQAQIDATAGPQVRMSGTGFWLFEDKEANWTVSLGPEFLSLETRHYRQFGEFVGRFLELSGLAARLYGIELRERLGLRYVDRVSRARQPFLPEDWAGRVRPDLLPLRRFGGGVDPQMNHVEARFSFGPNRMLTVHTLFVDRGFPGFAEEELVLDFDCYVEQRDSLDGIREDLVGFKQIAYNAFRWALGDVVGFFEPAQPAG
jgi:uncharacterized protein (TIGR04255 family)